MADNPRKAVDYFPKTRAYIKAVNAEIASAEAVLKVSPFEKMVKAVQEELRGRDKELEELKGMVKDMATTIEKISEETTAIINALSLGESQSSIRTLFQACKLSDTSSDKAAAEPEEVKTMAGSKAGFDEANKGAGETVEAKINDEV